MTTTYTVGDQQSQDTGLDFAEAVERITEWYEDCDQWATGDGDDEQHAAIRSAIDAVSQPETGGLSELEQFAASICQSVAEALGAKDFAGHGNYSVSAADEAGLGLYVREDEPEQSETDGMVCVGEWGYGDETRGSGKWYALPEDLAEVQAAYEAMGDDLGPACDAEIKAAGGVFIRD